MLIIWRLMETHDFNAVAFVDDDGRMDIRERRAS